MKPFYFGDSARPLFGIHHPRESAEDLDCAVVVCPPVGQEAINAHRTLRLLATRLAREGCHVLRFDYHGCGDSSGSDEDGNFTEWQRDVLAALEEIRDTSGARRSVLVGLRLGASLAARVGADGARLHGAVLWEPVIEGARYIEEIVAQHREMVVAGAVRPPAPSTDPSEALGFPITDTLRADLGALDLKSQSRSPAEHVLVVGGTWRDASRGLVEALRGIGSDCDSEFVESPAFWAGVDMGRPLVPVGAIECVVKWLGRICR